MTELARIEETLSKLTAGELAEVQAMLDRLQMPAKSAAARPHLTDKPVPRDRPNRPTFEEIKPLLEKAELTEEELEKIEQYNGFYGLRKRGPGPLVTVEEVQRLIEEEGI
ncbi:MAG TPA: hypothetical protein VGO11_24130 [Chthoniobacteraceae bacterium]|jgi:hypothetical protein|nr:hypothetical protein [Chthoniobacteraceae bacterium]